MPMVLVIIASTCFSRHRNGSVAPSSVEQTVPVSFCSTSPLSFSKATGFRIGFH